MTSEQVTFTAKDVPFDRVTLLMISVQGAEDTQHTQLTANDVPATVEITPRDGAFSYQTTFVMDNGQAYHPPAATSRESQVAILSPFRSETVSLNLVLQKPPVIEQFTITARHVYEGLSEWYDWKTGNSSQPWTLLTPAPIGRFEVRYHGDLQLTDGRQLHIPETMVAFDAINVSAKQFGFSVKVDPSQIHWSAGIDQVHVDVYQLTANQQMTDIQSLQFRPGDCVQYCKYLTDFQTGILYYFRGQYWYAGDSNPRQLPQTRQTSQSIVLPAGIDGS